MEGFHIGSELVRGKVAQSRQINLPLNQGFYRNWNRESELSLVELIVAQLIVAQLIVAQLIVAEILIPEI